MNQPHHPNTIAVQVKADLYWFFEAIAKREGGSVAAVINDELRRRMGDR